MKKLLMSVSLLALLTSAQTFAASSASDSLDLQGTVALDMAISFSPAAKAAALLLNLDLTSAQPIGELSYSSNSESGFHIDFASQNEGRMVRQLSGGGESAVDKIGYVVRAAAIEDQAGEVVVMNEANGPAGTSFSVAYSAPISRSTTLSFTSDHVMDAPGVSNPLALVSGIYKDKIIATITAN